MLWHDRQPSRLIAATALASALLINSAGLSKAPEPFALDQPAPTPIRLDFWPPATLPPGQELVVVGHNDADRVSRLVVRIDDGTSAGYASRINTERVVPPGPFVLRMPSSGLKTPSGRLLDSGDIRRLIVFTGSGDPAVTIERMAVEASVRLPDGARGFDFGGVQGPVFPGFERVDPGDPRLTGDDLRAITRPSGDALIADGIRGVTGFSLPWPDGVWKVTLWTEDLGEWEFLPHPLEQRIRINGTTVRSRRGQPTEWIAQRYLAGRDRPLILQRDGSIDVWETIGAHRGDRLGATVTVAESRMTIELAGGSPQSLYLAGLLVEPAGQGGTGRRTVRDMRATRFRELWRAERQPIPARPPSLVFGEAPADGIGFASRPTTTGPVRRIVAAGSSTTLSLIAVSPQPLPANAVEVEPPRQGRTRLPIQTWAGQWRLDRRNTAANLLAPTLEALRADGTFIPHVEGLPDRFVIRVSVPAGTPVGRYDGAVRLEAIRIPIEIIVPPVVLPPAPVPVGVYLEAPAHFGWFPALRPWQDTAVRCDLRFLRSLGLTGIAPPLPTPDATGGQFLASIATVTAAGFQTPYVGYAPAKRLIADIGLTSAAERIGQVERLLEASGLPLPAWSIADEPSNPAHGTKGVTEVASALRRVTPDTRLAGHLNTPRDRRFVDLFDMVLINPGFGVSAATVRRLTRAGKPPWFYNMGAFRLAAGFYLWRTGAGGYLQWHARMPTADPFDPTDGREADVQFLYPSAHACPDLPDINAGLLDLAEGVLDLRWLSWLDTAAKRNDTASRLRTSLHRAIPTDFLDARALPADQLDAWRQDIVDLAMHP